MRCRKKKILFLFLLLNAFGLYGQITPQPERRGSRVIDDTTKQIYGPNTSRYYYERDVFYNRDVLHPVDTVIRNFHRNAWYVQRNNNLYQDLGNIGTAIRPVYYQTPADIGASLGFHAYDLYWDSEQIRYFDTKSPYSNMELLLGGKGRSLTRATFSRNINPRWNFGFTYRGLFIDKQIQRTGKGDRITRSNYYDVYTAYENKDSTYRLFLNLRRVYHRVNEFGGVQLDPGDTIGLAGYFDINARPWLTKASSEDLRTNFHLYHQYRVGTGLQLYHTLDRYKQRNKFLDVENAEQAAFYDFIPLQDDSVKDAATLRSVRNEVGIKGNLLKLFYNGYIAIRHFHMKYDNLSFDTLSLLTPDTKGNETYFGGRMALDLDTLLRVNGWVEVMQQAKNTNYRLEGSIHSPWFEASLKQLLYQPGFLLRGYRGAHDYWDHSSASTRFDDVDVTQLNGYLHYKNKVVDLAPGITFTRLRNYIFFDQVTTVDTLQQVLPVQSSGNHIVVSPEIRFALTFFRHVTFSNQAIYTLFLENADDAIRVPELFVNSQLSYANIFFDGNLDMHAGADLHWKSAYYAPGYDPAIQQFYNQDVFESPAFPVVDLFFNAKIKRARIFFKYNNLMQLLWKRGYMPTPFYPGQRNILDFGFDWSFYD